MRISQITTYTLPGRLSRLYPGLSFSSKGGSQIRLSTEEKETLLRWMRSSKAEQRMVQRARVILLAASGLNG
jgi:hypothetical protein